MVISIITIITVMIYRDTEFLLSLNPNSLTGHNNVIGAWCLLIVSCILYANFLEVTYDILKF